MGKCRIRHTCTLTAPQKSRLLLLPGNILPNLTSCCLTHSEPSADMSQLNIFTGELRNISLHRINIHIGLKTLEYPDPEGLKPAYQALKDIDELSDSRNMNTYLQSVEGVAKKKSGNDVGWGPLGGESQVMLQVRYHHLSVSERYSQ